MFLPSLPWPSKQQQVHMVRLSPDLETACQECQCHILISEDRFSHARRSLELFSCFPRLVTVTSWLECCGHTGSELRSPTTNCRESRSSLGQGNSFTMLPKIMAGNIECSPFRDTTITGNQFKLWFGQVHVDAYSHFHCENRPCHAFKHDQSPAVFDLDTCCSPCVRTVDSW